MYLDGPRIALALGALAMGLGVWWLTNQYQANQADTIAEIEGRTTPSAIDAAGGPEAYRQQILEDIEAFAEAVAIRLTNLDVDGAKTVYRERFSDLERRVNAEGHVVLPSGTTLYERFQAVLTEQNEQLASAMDRLLDRLASGEGDPENVKDLLHRFHGTSQRNVRELYDARWREVEEARRPIVANWCRVRFHGPEGYVEAVREHVLNRIELPEGKRLVFDPAFTSNEYNWTWLQVSISFDETLSRYSTSGGTRVQGGATIPEALALQIEVRPGTRPKATTSWDDLPPLQVFYETPEHLSAYLDDPNDVVTFEDRQEDARKSLTESIGQVAASLPAFTIAEPNLARDADAR